MYPIYTPQNCTPAYQLDWSYTLFWHEIPRDWSWFASLQQVCEGGGIRLLEHAFSPPYTSQFLVSTRPHVAPLLIAQRVKGRLQHLLRGTMSNPFRRNYGLRSIGSTAADDPRTINTGTISISYSSTMNARARSDHGC